MDRIKESFDSLPIAVCFFDKNGMVRLVNHRMLTVLNHLRKNGVQTLAELQSALQAPAAGSLASIVFRTAGRCALCRSGSRHRRESDIRNSPPQTSRN